jgi:ribosomal protein S18 acetylase RimI-like enzyme
VAVAELSLREAVLEDAGEIARIHVASWRTAYRGLIADAELDGLSVHERTAEWRDRLRLGVETLIAVDAGAIVGFCALRRDAEPPAEPVEIGALYLDPAVLRRGIGSRLMDETLARLRTAGDPAVTLWVLAGNARARAFYVRHGFELTGESDQWHGADEVRMRLALTS